MKVLAVALSLMVCLGTSGIAFAQSDESAAPAEANPPAAEAAPPAAEPPAEAAAPKDEAKPAEAASGGDKSEKKEEKCKKSSKKHCMRKGKKAADSKTN